ncbi:4-hydroxy-3-methylbut-2-enyl diphosphate reductase, putative (LytB), partial [Plasmodium ovale curtisi]
AENPEDNEEIIAGVTVKDYNYLLNMPIFSLTLEKVEELLAQLKEKEQELEILKSITVETMWLKDIEKVEEAIEFQRNVELANREESNKFKAKKNKDIYFLGMQSNRNEKLNETKCGGGCGACSSQINTNNFETNDSTKNEDEKNDSKILYLINPRGFCKGVSRAIETVEECLKTFKTNIYVKHKIVHNDIVCKDLESKGAIFIEDLNEVPDGSILIYSAHGISPQIRELAKKKKLIEIDATCPLVNKVHVYVKLKEKEGYKIILIGYKNHVEVVGTYNEAPDSTYIVENVEQVNNLNFPENQKLFYVTQTTLSIDDCSLIVNKLKEKYPHIETIPSGSICYATTNRQKALNKICTECDLTIVVGSQSSSNAKKLVYSSQIRNTDAILVNTVNDFDFSSLENVKKIALTSAASTPDELTQQFVKVLTNPPYNYKLSIFDGVEEIVPKWKLPKELINMIKQKNEEEYINNMKNKIKLIT